MKRITDGYKKRGLIYIALALAGIGYEVAFVQLVRPIVLILWLAVIGIGIAVMLTLRDS